MTAFEKITLVLQIIGLLMSAGSLILALLDFLRRKKKRK